MLQKLTLVFLLSAILFACSPAQEEGLHDLIQPVVLTAGRSDTLLVSDLFYSKDYSLEFQVHPQIEVKYDKTTRSLILKSQPDFEGFTLLRFSLEKHHYAMPVYSRVKQKHRFIFKPEARPQSRMNVMGTFNDWNRNSLPLQDDDQDGIYARILELDPGQYLYQFVVDETETWDPKNPTKVDNGFGSYNSVMFVPPRHTEKATLHIVGFEPHESPLQLSFAVERENQPDKLDAADVFCLLDNSVCPDEWIAVTENNIAVHIPLHELAGERVFRIIVSQQGQSTNMQTVRLFDGLPIGADGEFNSWYDAILYSIMIDRFADGDPSNNKPVEHPGLLPPANYHGGDLQGVVDKIESGYFDSLGVNTLWLSPVNENPDSAFKEWPPPHRLYSGYHGYWPIHHQRVDTRFGDMGLLKGLVQIAHQKGMRVLLDFTANHVHAEHPFFKAHRDWFGTYDLPDGRKNIRLWDEYRLTTWFEPFMPSFDYVGSEEALQTMTDNAIWWLQETGADGFRQDATKHIPTRFWRVLTRKIKKKIEIPQNRRIYQIGETYGSYDLISSFVNNGQLNAQFNFNLYDTALYVFLSQDVDFSILEKEMQKTFSVYGHNHLMGNLMDNHDKIRFMAYADDDIELNSSAAQEIGWTNPPRVDHPESYKKARLYLAYLLTIPGVPGLYYGDEIGLTGAADPDNRRMMRFGKNLSEQEAEMLTNVRELVHLRQKHSALRYGDFQALVADKNCFAYLRSDMNERILVLLNKSEQQQSRLIPIPVLYEITRATDLISGQTYVVNEGSLSAILPPMGFSILRLE